MQQADALNPVIIHSPLPNLAAAFQKADDDADESAHYREQIALLLEEGIANRTRSRYYTGQELLQFYYRMLADRNPPN